MESESCDFSFITYLLSEEQPCLKDIQESIKDIKKKLKKENINAEWIVVVDGQSDEYHLKYADKVVQNYSHQGISISKNKALDKANGKWVLSIDANEKLHSDAINILLSTEKQPDYVKWVMSNSPPSINIDDNQIKRGLLSEMYQKQQIHIEYPNNVIIKKEALSHPLLKGWLNIPSHEDIGTLLVVSELNHGVVVNEPISIEKKGKEEECKIRMMNQPFSFNKISEIINKIRNKEGKEEIALSKIAC